MFFFQCTKVKVYNQVFYVHYFFEKRRIATTVRKVEVEEAKKVKVQVEINKGKWNTEK